ncbi:MAG: hypothetical protein EOP92_06045 [Lysobacteraceae bacterium]|nr:MAG: hypothetical protein EOP92_06045 [Xanthomonadaceae bacterium]
MRALTLMAASAFCLLGCMTPQQRAQNQQAKMDRMIADYGPACAQLGYPQNSDLWRDCVLQLAAKNDGGGVSTSVFGSWGSGGHGSGVGIGIGFGR